MMGFSNAWFLCHLISEAQLHWRLASPVSWLAVGGLANTALCTYRSFICISPDIPNAQPGWPRIDASDSASALHGWRLDLLMLGQHLDVLVLGFMSSMCEWENSMQAVSQKGGDMHWLCYRHVGIHEWSNQQLTPPALGRDNTRLRWYVTTKASCPFDDWPNWCLIYWQPGPVCANTEENGSRQGQCKALPACDNAVAGQLQCTALLVPSNWKSRAWYLSFHSLLFLWIGRACLFRCLY
jgi:hypothetical protein